MHLCCPLERSVSITVCGISASEGISAVGLATALSPDMRLASLTTQAVQGEKLT